MKTSDLISELKGLSTATASKVGQEYFDSLVKYLSRVLELDYVFIGELSDDHSTIFVNSVCADGEIAASFSYPLADTPCAQVVDRDTCVIRAGVQALFPSDILLQEMGIEGYVGTPLFSANAKPIGLIVGLHRAKIENIDLVKGYFDLAVGQISAEYERLKIIDKLVEQEKRFRDLVECSSDMVWETDEDLNYTYSSVSPEGLLGYHPEEVIGKSPFDLMPDEEKEAVKTAVTPIIEKRQPIESLENKILHKNGSVFYVETSAVPIFNNLGEFKGYRGVDRDITIQKLEEHELKLAATVFENASEAMMVTDKNNRTIKVNRAFNLISGYSNEEVLGKTPSFLKSGHHSDAFYREMHKRIDETGRWEGEIWNRRKNGEIYPQWLTISILKDQNSKPNGYVSLFSDISKRKEYEAKIEYQANYDALTGLANRHLLVDRFSDAIERANRKGTVFALLFIDLDRFKQVNDSFGHSFGDKLLKEVANRLNSHTRKTDTTARLGGDEFAIIFPDLPNRHHAEDSIRNLLKVLSEPYIIDENDIYISASIGVTIYPDDGDTVEELLKNADSAMYRSKAKGRNTYQYYSAAIHQEAEKRHQLENALHHALLDQEFELHYQPIVDSKTKTTVGCEALIRWMSQDLGRVNPNDFIPLAEDSGLIIQIGRWVLEEACKTLAAIQKTRPGRFIMSVNVSTVQFQRGRFPQLVSKTIETYQIDPSNLVFEITESLMMNQDSLILNQLEELRAIGVGLSIDDFGTGYSSLSYLQRFPVTTLKIDRAFVIDLDSNKQNRALVRAILAMAKSLDLKVVVEGIEREDQAEVLLSEGSQYFQGFLYSQPIPFNLLLNFLDKSAD